MDAFVLGDKKIMMITVLIADDHPGVRDIFRLLLESAGDIDVVALAVNGKEAVEQAALYSPAVVVMDVSMPVMGGIEATRQIVANTPDVRVLMISMYDDANYVGNSVRAGAWGYVLKDMAGHELVTAIRAIHSGNRYFSKKTAPIAQLVLSETEKTGPISDIESDLYPPPAPV